MQQQRVQTRKHKPFLVGFGLEVHTRVILAGPGFFSL